MTNTPFDAFMKYDPRCLANIYLDNIDIDNIAVNTLYDRYFSDHVIKRDAPNAFNSNQIHLRRNDQLFYYVEELADYAKMVKDFFPNFHPTLLPYYFAWGEKSLLCLNDSWCCLGWINYYLNNCIASPDQEITLIHFDSHSDLANPLIAKQVGTGAYYDLLRGTKIDINSLFDFFIAVAIGSIGISNYISILPLFHRSVNVFYINQFKQATSSYRYALDFKKDDIFHNRYPDLLRMHNNYDPHNSEDYTRYPHRCIEANFIGDCANFIDNNQKIYLHFDMDYFNNYLDGSAPQFRNNKNYRTLEQQHEMIDKTMEVLQQSKENIVHTSIGLSPGFFPSQYWEPTTKYLINSLNSHGIHFSIEKTFPQVDS